MMMVVMYRMPSFTAINASKFLEGAVEASLLVIIIKAIMTATSGIGTKTLYLC